MNPYLHRSIILAFLFVYGIGGGALAFPLQQQDKWDDFFKKGENFFETFSYDTAALYYDSALTAAERSGKNLDVAYLLFKKGRAQLKADSYDASRASLKKARLMARKIDHDSVIALSDIELGWVYLKKGLLDSSAYYYHHALEVYEGMGDTLGMGIAMHNLSTYYRSKGDYQESLKYALASNRILKKSNKKLLYCRSLLTMGNIYHNIREYDTALSCYEMCQAISQELGNDRLTIKSTFNKGATYLSLGKNEQAKDEMLRALEISKKVNYYKDLSLIYQVVSIAYRRLDQPEASLAFSEEALALAREIGEKELEIHALTNLGVNHKKVGNLEKAEMYYLEGIRMAEKYHFLNDMRRAYINMAMFYKATNDYRQAYEYQEKYIAVDDSIVNNEKAKAREKYKAEYELLHYKDQNRIKDLEKKEIRFERNLSYGIGATLVFLLIVFVFFLRMRSRKNRIIAAQKIQKLEDEKRLLAAQAVLVGQEKERERIARELHDGIGVLLSTASIHFSSVERKADKETGEMLKKANKLLKEAGHEVRQISHNMMPGVLSKFGLREAIEDLFDELVEATEIETDIDIVCRDEKRLPENMEIMIYRIVQEMLNNTLKYANAMKIRFHITRCEELVKMQFSDDGIGFDEASLPHDKSLGLSGIRSRVDYLGGKMTLETKPGKGVRFDISIPINRNADNQDSG